MPYRSSVVATDAWPITSETIFTSHLEAIHSDAASVGPRGEAAPPSCPGTGMHRLGRLRASSRAVLPSAGDAGGA